MIRIETRRFVNVDFCKSDIVEVALIPGDMIDGNEIESEITIVVAKKSGEGIEPVSINGTVYGIVGYGKKQ